MKFYKLYTFFFLITQFLISACMKKEKKDTSIEKNCSIDLLSSDFQQNKIIDGCSFDRSTAKAFPAAKGVVSLVTPSGLCTGTYISKHIVLTAAHCFDIKRITSSEIELQNEIENTYIISSTHHSVFDAYDSVKEKFKTNVKEIIIHPFYSENCKNDSREYQAINKCNFADLALIYTEKSAKQIHAKPVPISTKLNDEETIYFVGYGKTDDYDQSQTRIKRWGIAHLHETDFMTFLLIPFAENSLATFYKQQFTPFISEHFHEDPRNVFLFVEGQASGIWQGDSGGPLFIKDNNQFYTIGVVHANEGEKEHICKNKKSINTYIEPYLDWIKSESKKLKENIHFHKR